MGVVGVEGVKGVEGVSSGGRGNRYGKSKEDGLCVVDGVSRMVDSWIGRRWFRIGVNWTMV